MSIISSVFDTRAEADTAVDSLRDAGVASEAISVIAQDDGRTTSVNGAGETADGEVGGNFIKGSATGAGLGAIIGIAALAIPGVGPLVAAGAIAQSAIAGAAVAGAALGAAAGGLAGALTEHGVEENDARFYESRINEGGIFVSVDTAIAGIDAETAADVLYAAGGYNSTRGKAASAAPPYTPTI